MAYQVLARKWRPKSFKEMVGQEHVLRALINALDENRLHHAYLFTGTRGVGKTTIARIIAKSLNCEKGVSSSPCCECSTCKEIDEGRFVDLIEVDAASRTKVEDTRELLENVQYAPTRGRYKVYLIDEVHMLSTSSFNALLKTLEEPPEHVKFLLATTDPQKLPATVLSRCLQFNLKRMPMDQIIAHHKHILTEESIEFEDTALSLIARAADGSMRDSLSLLDQSIAFGQGKVMQADVATMLGSISYDFIAHIIQALSAHDGDALMSVVDKLDERAPDFLSVLNELATILHQLALIKRIPDAVDESLMDKAQLIALSDGLSEADIQLYYQIALIGKRDLPLAPSARTGFEMVLLRMLAFTPNAEGATPMPVARRTPVKKPEAQQVSASSAVIQNITADKSESKPAEANNEASINTGAGETPVVDAVQHAPERASQHVSENTTEDVPVREVAQKTLEDVPPQHGVEAPVQSASQPALISKSVSQPALEPAQEHLQEQEQPEVTAESAVEVTFEKTITTADEAETAQSNQTATVQHQTEQSADAQPKDTQPKNIQSRVSRRAQLRAQRHQDNQTALPSTVALIGQASEPAKVSATTASSEQRATQQTQAKPNEPLNTQGSDIGSAHLNQLVSTPVNPPQGAPLAPALEKSVESFSNNGVERTVEQRAEKAADKVFEQSRPLAQTASGGSLTPEELAVYEEYAGMVDDDETIGYDLALDQIQPRQVAEPSLPPHNQTQAIQPAEPVSLLAEQVQKPEAFTSKSEQSKSAELEPQIVEKPEPNQPSFKADDASQLVWFELLERVDVEGLPRQLAENCALRSRVKKGEQVASQNSGQMQSQVVEQARIELVLNSSYDTLLNEASKQALQEALSNYLGTPQDLKITVGNTADISETPAERKTRLFGERHNHAIDAIMQDPNVVMMQSIFGATVDESLIKPIELNASY